MKHLVLSFVPPPQVAEQEVHDPQSPTSQSTEYKAIKQFFISTIEYLPGSLQATLQLRVSATSMILDFAHFKPLPMESDILSLQKGKIKFKLKLFLSLSDSFLRSHKCQAASSKRSTLPRDQRRNLKLWVQYCRKIWFKLACVFNFFQIFFEDETDSPSTNKKNRQKDKEKKDDHLRQCTIDYSSSQARKFKKIQFSQLEKFW